MAPWLSLAAVKLVRRRHARRALAALAADLDAYQAAWRAATERSGADGLASLCVLADDLAARCPARAVEHRCRTEAPRSLLAEPPAQAAAAPCRSARVGTGCRSGRGDVRTPELEAEWPPAPSARVTSLDRLYSLAVMAAPLLEKQCRGWAERSHGELDDSDLGEVGNGLGEGLPGMDRLLRARLLKLPGRAAEKALARYGGDAARVLDVCRCRLLFDAVGDIVDCLREAAASAPAVRILCVRSSMHPLHDPILTGGFRVSFRVARCSITMQGGGGEQAKGDFISAHRGKSMPPCAWAH